MDANVIWQSGLNFSAHSDSGSTLDLGAENKGFRPMELFAIGLAGCTAMDVISIMEKKRQQVSHFEVKVHAERAEEHPKVFTRAKIEYLVSGQSIDESALVRSIELSASRYCPAQAMFEKVFPIDLVYSIFEDQENGERLLVKSGDYQHSPAAKKAD